MADPGLHKRNLYPPSAPDGPIPDGDDVIGVKRAISRAGYFPWQPFDDSYSEAIANAVMRFQQVSGLTATGYYGEPTHNKLKYTNTPPGSPNANQDAYDDTAARLYKGYHPGPGVPDLGPTYKGGKKMLLQDLTHATSGIPLYPAYDDAFDEGLTIIAPEDLKVTKASSSSPGDACYCEGKSGIRYWFGHLVSAPNVGVHVVKGGYIGKTCENHQGGGPHGHIGVNVENLWGAGKEMTHKTTYSHGAPLIGDQLEAGHAL